MYLKQFVLIIIIELNLGFALNVEIVCSGITEFNTSPDYYYQNFVDKFTNCTYIDGNLNLEGFQNDFDLSFLNKITEVTGYVLISEVNVHHVVFPRLKIIRGKSLFKFQEKQFSIFVKSSRIHTLKFPELGDILSGSVGFYNNSDLCYMDTIKWDKIMSGINATYWQNNSEHNCSSCHSSCEGACWSNGTENCQNLSKIICSSECSLGRCFGTQPNQCCDDLCAVGCEGTGPKNCIACRSVFNYEEGCESKCRRDSKPLLGTCSKRTCRHSGVIKSGDFDKLRGCTKIIGSLEILTDTFDVINFHEKLNALLTVKEVTGYINIRGQAFRSLSFLRNLEVIGGEESKKNDYAALKIFDTSLVSLQLHSLRDIRLGDVVIMDNKWLCNADKINWKKIMKSNGYKYEITQNRNRTECLNNNNCSEECSVEGCWGPGPDDCLECRNFQHNVTCVQSCQPYNKNDSISCTNCLPICQKCIGSGSGRDKCDECNGYVEEGYCKSHCSSDYYTLELYRICIPCDLECVNCNENSSLQCNVMCTTHTINNTTFLCKKVPEKGSNNSFIWITITLGIFVILYCTIWYLLKQFKQQKAAKMLKEIMMNKDSGPNLIKLRIIYEANLQRGGELGMGAFGKVYTGVWIPEKQKYKIPVAVKVLMNITGSQEFLDEAYIMASVDHPNLLNLLAVCMTQEMMLITQLMPLGCLLNYVRKNKKKIGSKAFLDWFSQIADGMSYLEKNRIIHRDLAARNILVLKPSLIKITDFGLAKLLDSDTDEYEATGGKLPIKWLAVECIRYRKFTSKSDVWAFGVTLWELLSYGDRPYADIENINLLALLEKGCRLGQPSICTLDVYMILISCWVLKADLRPTFKILYKKFVEMAGDPERYLVIPNDKFLRLPSYTSKNEKDLLESLVQSHDNTFSFTFSSSDCDGNYPITTSENHACKVPGYIYIDSCYESGLSTEESDYLPMNGNNSLSYVSQLSINNIE